MLFNMLLKSLWTFCAKSIFIILFLTFIIKFERVSAIKCYTCGSSELSSHCSDPFKRRAKIIEDTNGLCYKFSDPSINMVVRGLAINCINDSMLECCYKDLCNSAPFSLWGKLNSAVLFRCKMNEELVTGHYFAKKSFHKPTYCQNCGEMLWGLIGQGYSCEVCNFVVHDRCLKAVVTPCLTLANSLVKVPVSHSWTDAGHFKRKFCNVCRKRLDDSWAVRCEICDYYAHLDCQDFAVCDCRDCATFTPFLMDDQNSGIVQNERPHHWKEGNLPSNSKCAICKKTCWSSECLTGIRCDWCGITAHATCANKRGRNHNISVAAGKNCDLGNFAPIMLPPEAVSLPRTHNIPKEILLGLNNTRTVISLNEQQIVEEQSSSSSDYKTSKDENESSGTLTSSKKENKAQSQQDSSKDDGSSDTLTFRIFEGNIGYRKQQNYRTLVIRRGQTLRDILLESLHAFHLPDQANVNKYLLGVIIAPPNSNQNPISNHANINVTPTELKNVSTHEFSGGGTNELRNENVIMSSIPLHQSSIIHDPNTNMSQTTIIAQQPYKHDANTTGTSQSLSQSPPFFTPSTSTVKDPYYPTAFIRDDYDAFTQLLKFSQMTLTPTTTTLGGNQTVIHSSSAHTGNNRLDSTVSANQTSPPETKTPAANTKETSTVLPSTEDTTEELPCPNHTHQDVNKTPILTKGTSSASPSLGSNAIFTFTADLMSQPVKTGPSSPLENENINHKITNNEKVSLLGSNTFHSSQTTSSSMGYSSANFAMPSLILRQRFTQRDEGFITIYPGLLRIDRQDPLNIPIDANTCVVQLIELAINAFQLNQLIRDCNIQTFQLLEMVLDKDVIERVMEDDEKPWILMQNTSKDSIYKYQATRFCLQYREDSHGPNISVFVGNLPPSLSQRQYEAVLSNILLDKALKYSHIGPFYYEFGCLIMSYTNASVCVQAFKTLRNAFYDDKPLQVFILPIIHPSRIPANITPLLIFVNVKSGGCQGLSLISSFRKLLNPFQVCDLDNGGPLPGLFMFRNVLRYKILICGGDGTVGWVLSCLDNVGQDSKCENPPCGVIPLGTGNDLARVLNWGPGYTGAEDANSLLRDVIEAEEVRLDRWTLVFHPDDKYTDDSKYTNWLNNTQNTEDNTQIYIMNNYCGIGLDADISLDFHMARTENPSKFSSRLHNKSVYLKMGLRKMMKRKVTRDLQKDIKLEVDGKEIEIPPVEGLVILNILSWGSGANLWGAEKEDPQLFQKPTHYDGMLEIVGVSGVVHMGQIQSGLRSGLRIAQGGHIRITMYTEIPVQVDGEPWLQQPGQCVVLKSALKASMLRKVKHHKSSSASVVSLPLAIAPLAPKDSIQSSTPGSLEFNNNNTITAVTPYKSQSPSTYIWGADPIITAPNISADADSSIMNNEQKFGKNESNSKKKTKSGGKLSEGTILESNVHKNNDFNSSSNKSKKQQSRINLHQPLRQLSLTTTTSNVLTTLINSPTPGPHHKAAQNYGDEKTAKHD